MRWGFHSELCTCFSAITSKLNLWRTKRFCNWPSSLLLQGQPDLNASAVGLSGWNVCQRDVFTLESQETRGSKLSPVWLIGWVCSQSLQRLNHQAVPLQSSRVFSHWLLKTIPSSRQNSAESLSSSFLWVIQLDNKKSKEVIVGKWTLKASKRNLDRGICSAVKTVSSNMNYSVFVRNRVMFTASIQIS